MACYRNIVLIALIFLIATPPRAHGVIIGGGNIAQVNVLGLLSCAVPGTLPILGSSPLPGVSVNVTCNGGAVILGQAVTNTAGFLNATFNVVDGLLFDSSTCVATANLLGVVSCSVLPPTGILRVSLVPVGVVQGVLLLVTGLIL
ncbi:S-acyltransferase [Psidium guajava]|nr:S-acyltransferase [Psidium guajava]